MVQVPYNNGQDVQDDDNPWQVLPGTHISHKTVGRVGVPQLLSTAFGAVHKVALASAARRKLSAKNVKLFA